MSRVGYYPGCSLEATARDYQESWQALARALDIELCEVPDWNCCGASAGHSLDEAAALSLAARNLAQAADGPQPVVVPCALCFNRLKHAQHDLAQPGARAPKGVEEVEPCLSVQVVELNSFLTTPEMIERINALKKRDLSGLSLVCYYGCQGQRPPVVTGHPAPENPTGMERLLGALGAKALDWPGKTDCCGASHTVARPDLVHTLTARLFDLALARGAQCIVTGCQMCQANLDLQQAGAAAVLGRELSVPVLYLTELVGLALGLSEAPRWLKRHLVSPGPLLQRAGLAAAGET